MTAARNKPDSELVSLSSRRQFLRARAPDTLQVEISEESFQTDQKMFPVYDVSVYGISFLVPRRLAPSLTPGAAIHSIRFNLDGKELQVTGVVRYATDFPTPQEQPATPREHLCRIGIEFTDIGPETVWLLSDYVVRLHGAEPAEAVPMSKTPTKAKKTKKKIKKKKITKKKAKKKTAKPKAARKAKNRPAPKRKRRS